MPPTPNTNQCKSRSKQKKRCAIQEEEYVGVVGGNDRDNIDSLLFEIAIVLDIRRKMFDLTSRGECSRNSKQNDFLALEFLPI